MNQNSANKVLQSTLYSPDFRRSRGNIESVIQISNIENSIRNIRLKLQEIDDVLNGGIVARNLKETRNTYCVNYQESMTDANDLYVYFTLIPEMTRLIYAKVYMNIITGTPNITFYVSEDEGTTYSSVYGPYSTDQSAINITSELASRGNKLIKVETDANTLLDFQVILQMDIIL